MSNATRRAALLLVIGLTLTACAPIVRLPTVASDGSACRGVGLDGILRGDPTDSRVAWVESRDPRGVASRVDVVFPTGFSARFTPSLEVLDSEGRTAARDGDPISGGCVTGPNTDGPLLILGIGSSDIRAR